MPAKKKTAKKVKRVRYYGMVSLRKGTKAKWVSQENKNGWSLGLKTKDRPVIWLRNVRFATNTDVEKAVNGAEVEFIAKVK